MKPFNIIYKSFFRISIFLFLLSTVGCIPNRDYNLFQNPKTKQGNGIQRAFKGKQYIDTTSGSFKTTKLNYLVKVGDLLIITVKSDAQIDKVDNIFSGQQGGGAVGGAPGQFAYFNGLLVDTTGYIYLPQIGGLFVNGKSLDEVRIEVEKRVKEYYLNKEIWVSVKLGGFSYSIMGEVARPGAFFENRAQLNVIEAISNAGGFGIYANRANVMLMRQVPGGFETHRLDFTKTDIISSPYFWLQPNDIIYIEALPQREMGLATNGYGLLVNILGVISSTLLIISILKK